MKTEFEFATLDEALEGADKDSLRDRIHKANPEGIGPETQKVMREVYARRAEVKENALEYDPNDRHSVGCARLNAVSIIKGQGLKDGLSLGDIYADTAIAQAQWDAYTIAGGRMLETAKSGDDAPVEACNIQHLAKCMKGEEPGAILGDNFWQWTLVLGPETARKISEAVIKDMGITLEEAEALSRDYDALSGKTFDQLKKRGWKAGEPVHKYVNPGKE